MQKNSVLVAILTTLLAIVTTNAAWAGGESGFYLGVGVGNTAVEDDITLPGSGDSFSLDEDDTSYKIFGGFNFGLVPLVDVAVEGGYVNFGKPSGTSGGETVEYEIEGWDAFGLVGASFGPLGLFGKVGLIAWDTDKKIGDTTVNDSGTDAAYGLGVRFQLLSVSIRGEYERFELSEIDTVQMVSASVAYTF